MTGLLVFEVSINAVSWLSVGNLRFALSFSIVAVKKVVSQFPFSSYTNCHVIVFHFFLITRSLCIPFYGRRHPSPHCLRSRPLKSKFSIHVWYTPHQLQLVNEMVSSPGR
jgi:hypothetical protein